MMDNYDFSQGKRGAVIQHQKENINLYLDKDVLQWFRDQVTGGGDYQLLINQVLTHHIQHHDESLEDTLRRVIREEVTQKTRSKAA